MCDEEEMSEGGWWFCHSPKSGVVARDECKGVPLYALPQDRADNGFLEWKLLAGDLTGCCRGRKCWEKVS